MSSSVCSSTHSVPDDLLKLDPDRKYTILTCHADEYAGKFLVGPFARDLALIIAQYVVDGQVMDRQGWLKVFGVDIGEEADRVMQDLDFDGFYAVYHGPNPIDVVEHWILPRQVCESCLIPTIVPKRVMVEARVFEYNLNLLGELAEYEGINGHRAKYFMKTEALVQHGRDEVEETHLYIQLEGMIGYKKSWETQVQDLERLNDFTRYGCEVEPRALVQITTIFATYALTGQRHFGNDSGKKGRQTFSRTRELVVQIMQRECHMMTGPFIPASVGPLVSAPARLCVFQDTYDGEPSSVGIQRKFG